MLSILLSLGGGGILKLKDRFTIKFGHHIVLLWDMKDIYEPPKGFIFKGGWHIELDDFI